MKDKQTQTTPDLERIASIFRSIQTTCDYHTDWQEVPSIIEKINKLSQEGIELCQTKQ